ncbi:hypothetical protein GYMLUDRAFT_66111 [Collybiopsis luxurians FD-317 M1]|nr:hypothetical protein GYMLUDRAFT_66111 [Collybiopsis luxurians FD-317 M1]
MLSKGWPRFSSTVSSRNTLQTPSFLSILQNAAGRAWIHRAYFNLYRYSTAVLNNSSGDSASTDQLLAGPSPSPGNSRDMPSRPPRIHHLRFDCITEDDVKFSDPGRCAEPVCCDDDELGTPLARYPFRPPAPKLVQPRSLPPATSRNILYRNLVHLSCCVPPITLPQLMDYHDRYPETQSTRSYNLLISTAIRTASFGSAQWLLESMTAADIKRNLETYKLLIRWQIRTGAWDAAWQTLTGPPVLCNLPSENGGNDGPSWPDFLWLEFFGSLKRSGVRRNGDASKKCDDSLVVYAQRYLQLMENRPSFSLTHARPRVIHSIARALLQLQQKIQALRLVRTYFSHLPTHLTPELTLHCLDIIHILIVFGSSARGRKKFHEHRRILDSLLVLHPSFRPTSTTLFLLLGSLRGAVRCGALASRYLASFKHRWGMDIEDRRVRLRVASLALKQGRLDISGNMLFSVRMKEGVSSFSGSAGHGEAQWSSRRPRYKTIFRGEGKLRALEIRLGKRLRRAKRRRMYKLLNAIQTT